MPETGWQEPHDCVFPEVLIDEDDLEGPLKAGMRVLIPCETCGEEPHDHLVLLNDEWEAIGRALVDRLGPIPLFHWAPQSRRKQILRYGLRPGMRASVSTADKAPIICFADSPSWAWGLSGAMGWAPSGWWDLWETDLGRLDEPKILASPERSSGIYEVRTLTRVWKRDIWWVGSREK